MELIKLKDFDIINVDENDVMYLNKRDHTSGFIYFTAEKHGNTLTYFSDISDFSPTNINDSSEGMPGYILIGGDGRLKSISHFENGNVSSLINYATFDFVNGTLTKKLKYLNKSIDLTDFEFLRMIHLSGLTESDIITYNKTIEYELIKMNKLLKLNFHDLNQLIEYSKILPINFKFLA